MNDRTAFEAWYRAEKDLVASEADLLDAWQAALVHARQQSEPVKSAVYKIAAKLAMGEPMRPLNAVLDTGKSPYQRTCNAAEECADRLRVIAMHLRNAVDAAPPAGKICHGIPRPDCHYMAECGTVCNKCGKVHSANLLINMADAAPVQQRELTADECTALDAALMASAKRIAPVQQSEPSCDCTKYNGGQCYNCLNGAHRICDSGQGRCSMTDAPRIDEEGMRLLRALRPLASARDRAAIDAYLAKAK